jgi:hypothetical protein
MNRSAELSHDPISIGTEFLRVAGLLCALVAQLWIGAWIAGQTVDYCFTKPLWLDEFHTTYLVNEEFARDLLLKLSRGADFNPPGLHIVLWFLAKTTGLSDELLLRAFSFSVGALAFVAVYLILRQRFDWSVSWVSVLGMWSTSPLLIEHLFEGRFYGFWFATTAMLCLFLSLRIQGLWQFICVAFLAGMMCLIHYFGILSLGLIVLFQCLSRFRESRQRWLIATAITVGPSVVMASLPLYFCQKAALPIPTWVGPPTFDKTLNFIWYFVGNFAVAIPILVYTWQRLMSRDSGPTSKVDIREFGIYSGMCGLILLPVELSVFSYLIQPAQVYRYALPAVLAYAPFIALISQRLNTRMLGVTAALFFAIGLGAATQAFEMRQDFCAASALANAASAERPLIVHSRHVAYPLFKYTRLDPKVVRISYEYGKSRLSRVDQLEQAVALRMAELFDLPKPITPEELGALNEFYLLAAEDEAKRYENWDSSPSNLLLDQGLRENPPLRGYHLKRHLKD